MTNPFCPSYRKVASLLYSILAHYIVPIPQTQEKKIINNNNNNNKSRKDTFFFLVSTHIFSGEITYYYIYNFHGAQPLPMYVYNIIYNIRHRVFSMPRLLHYYRVQLCKYMVFIRRVSL